MPVKRADNLGSATHRQTEIKEQEKGTGGETVTVILSYSFFNGDGV